MKGLNLYAGVGGNRKLWTGIDVTAVENDPAIAEIYQRLYPGDKMIIGDAHQYLLDNLDDFDFIWSSPPCPTHSVTNSFLHAQGCRRYPDMKLYEEIIYLKHRYNGLFCVENVKSYYKPLIKPTEIDRHYFWSNFHITPFRVKRDFNITQSRDNTRIDTETYKRKLKELHGIDGPGITKEMLRNCVYPPLGQHILNCARGNTQQPLFTVDETKKRIT